MSEERKLIVFSSENRDVYCLEPAVLAGYKMTLWGVYYIRTTDGEEIWVSRETMGEVKATMKWVGKDYA